LKSSLQTGHSIPTVVADAGAVFMIRADVPGPLSVLPVTVLVLGGCLKTLNKMFCELRDVLPPE